MHAVILAGGKGTRLWPASTKQKPKFFIELDNKKSLLQNTFERVSTIASVDNIITVTNKNYLTQIKAQYAKIKNNINSEYIMEPAGKDTAAAILSSVLYIYKNYGANEIVLMMPTDHIITELENYHEAITKAETLAKTGKIVTLGITPTYAEENYGYIEFEQNKVLSFTEKPSKIVAENYVEAGNYLWNSGILCFEVGTFLNEMQIHCPGILPIVQRAVEASKYIDKIKAKEIYLNDHNWQQLQPISIDYALLEKTKNIAVVPCNINWQDIGNWNSISKLAPMDVNGNNIKGNAMALNASNCYIESNSRMIAVVGVKNLAIIETENGLLIVDKNNVADVKEIYSMINKKTLLAKIS